VVRRTKQALAGNGQAGSIRTLAMLKVRG